MNDAFQKWRNGEFAEASGILEGLVKDDDNRSLIARRNNQLVVEWTASESPRFQMILEGLEEAYDEAMCDQGTSTDKEWMIRKRKKDAMILIYNQAVIKFRQQKYDKAESLLTSIYVDSELRHDALSFCVPFLIIEICLMKGKLSGCVQFLELLDQRFASLEAPLYKTINWNEVFHQQSPLVEIQDPMISGIQLKAGNLRFPDVTKLGTPDEAIKVQDLQLMTQIYGLRTLFQMGRYSEVLSTLQELRKESEEGLPIQTVFLEAQCYLAMKKGSLAVQLLIHCHQQLTEKDRISKNCILHNLGLVYFQLGKPNLASLCFSTSIRSLRNAEKTEEIKKGLILSLYNTGLINLRKGSFSEALMMFTESSKILSKKPYVWLRMAECCIGLAQNDRTFKIKKLSKKEAVLPDIYILPDSSHPVLNPGSSLDLQSSEELLLTAYSYLQNALALIGHSSVIPGPSMDQSKSCESTLLRGMIYLKLAFITLSLDQPERCLYYTKQLKLLEGIDEETLFFGILYEVESLCLMDNSREAIKILKESLERRDFTRSEYDLKWMISHNLASVYCMRRDLEDAKNLTESALRIKPNSQESLMLLLYIELVRGNRQEALEIIHAHSSA